MTPKWIEDLAADFWIAAGAPEPFPRRLEHAMCCAKGVETVRLPGLSPGAIIAWLHQRGRHFPLETSERRLNGCLLIHRGTGFVFVESTLPAHDARMIVAHEFGHFLAEYDAPRERARRRLGPGLLAVFDGDRPPTAMEQLEASLTQVTLGAHVHYMDRRANGTYSEPVSQVERTANDLALALVAPRLAVLAFLGTARPTGTDAPRCTALLQQQFGLPGSWAELYAQRLVAAARQRRSFSEILGL